MIRELTNDQKTLTNFLHIFLGKGGNTGPLIVTYNRDELIRDLNEVVKYDWTSFLHDRIDLVNPHADLDGITRGGYKLIYQDHPSESIASMGGRRGGGPNFWYSLGLQITGDGTIYDVRWGSPADKAKLAPGQKLLGVNGLVYSGSALEQAVTAAKSGTEPIHLIMQSQTYLKPVDIDYHEGMKFPVMVRVEGTRDYLDEITEPLVKPINPTTNQ